MPQSVCCNCPLGSPPRRVRYTRGALNEIVLVGQSPARTEVLTGEGFTGESGQLLRKVMSRVGVTPGDVSFMNSLMCPEGIPGLTGRNLSTALKTCRPNLTAAIESIRPRLIIALGAHAMRTLLNKGNVLQNHGKLFWSEEFSCHIMTMIHPAAVMRGAVPNYPGIMEEDMNPIEKMFYRDWLSVAALRRNNYNPEQIPIFQGARAIDTSNYIEANAGVCLPALYLCDERRDSPVAFDIETTGLITDPKSEILSIAFCQDAGRAHVILADLVYGRYVFRADRRQFIMRLMESKRPKLVAGRPFDEMFLACRMGVTVQGPVIDVLTLAHLKDETYHSYSLESVASLFADMHNIKDLAEGKRTNLREASRETLIKYNAVDADATFRVYQQLQDVRNRTYYREFMQPVQDVLTATAILHPCKVSKEILERSKMEVNSMLESLENRFSNYVTPPVHRRQSAKGLSLTRTSFLRDVLFSADGLAIEPNPAYLTELTKEVQVTEEHLRDRLSNMSSHSRTGSATALEILLEWKKLHKLKTSYLNTIMEDAVEWPADDSQLDNGTRGNLEVMGVRPGEARIYPTTSMTRTVTGRAVILNPPMQTYPARGPHTSYIRSVFVPDDGYVFMSYDLSQSELRIIGWLAKDKKILDALNNDQDLHLLTAAELNQIPPDQVTKEMRNLAKGVNFGLIYGMSATKFQIYLKENYNIDISYNRCVTLHQRFFQTYSGIENYHYAQREFVQRHGHVVSPLGRIRHLPGIYSSDKKEKAEAERQAINSPVQSFSSDLGLLSETLIWQDSKCREIMKPMWFIHDAVMMQVRREGIIEAYSKIKKAVEEDTVRYISNKFLLNVGYPVRCDVKVGLSWSSMIPYYEWLGRDSDENGLIF